MVHLVQHLLLKYKQLKDRHAVYYFLKNQIDKREQVLAPKYN